VKESAPAGNGRNVVAKGMNRFDIGKTAPKQPLWEKLSDRVLCVVACNPNPFTLNGTCCYLVGTGSRRILIDTGEENVGHPQFMAALEDCMACNNIEGFQLILITHFHHDHYGGVAGLLERFGKDIPVGKLPSSDLFWLTLDIVRDRGLVQYLEDSSGTPFFPLQSFREQTVPFEYTRVWPDEEAESGNVLSWDPVGRTKEELIRDYSWVKRSWEHHTRMTQEYNFQPLSHCDVLTTEGATLVAFHTPGHAVDHCSFFLQEEKSLFSGDTVLGWGTTFINDLYDYMETLHFMVSLRPVHLYPGHGPMIEDGVGLLERYIIHRKIREDQVEDLLLQRCDLLSIDDVVDALYTETPPSRLWMAKENVQKILRKFYRSGLASIFRLQETGTLQPYRDAHDVGVVRRLPENLRWVHRAHTQSVVESRAALLPTDSAVVDPAQASKL